MISHGMKMAVHHTVNEHVIVLRCQHKCTRCHLTFLFLQPIPYSHTLSNAGDLSPSASIREESTRRLKKERGRKLRRYLLIGLATVGGGTVIGDYFFNCLTSCWKWIKSSSPQALQILALTAFSAHTCSSFARCDRWAGCTSGGSRGQRCAGGWRGCCSWLSYWHRNNGLSVWGSRSGTDWYDGTRLSTKGVSVSFCWTW